MENENTVVETGENQHTNDELIQKATEILNAINAKNEKNEKSIVNDNVKQFSDEEGQILRDLITAQKNKAKEQTLAKEKEKDDLIAKLQEENKTFKNKERQSLLNNSLNSIYDELGIVEEGAKKQAHKLAFAGSELSDFFNEDGTINTEKIKTAFSDVIADVPSLSSKKPEIEVKETKRSESSDFVKEQQDKIRKKWKLDNK